MEKKKHIFWELTLLIASVFVFRGLWILMDQIDFFNTSNNLVIFTIIGFLLTGISLYRIVHADRKYAKH